MFNWIAKSKYGFAQLTFMTFSWSDFDTYILVGEANSSACVFKYFLEVISIWRLVVNELGLLLVIEEEENTNITEQWQLHGFLK